MADFKILKGSATYRQRVPLHPEAVLDVELRDVSRADAPAPLLSSVSVRPDAQVPIPFKLIYDDDMIDQRYTYAVSARIRVGEKTYFRSTSTYPVLTRGNPDRVEVVMDMMPVADAATGIYDTVWTAESIGDGGVIDDAPPTITFAADGSVSGSSGCNKFNGTAEVDGDRIGIGPLAATQMACIPALAKQEQAFFALLTRAHSFEIDRSARKLVLKDSAGVTLARFAPGKRPDP